MRINKTCECGCGLQLGKYATRFRHGHWAKANRETISITRRKGVIEHTKGGYLMDFHNGKRRLQHLILVEIAIGRPLPKGAEVHHVNSVKSDNRPENLVICQDRAYHVLLHVRTTAYLACGDANKRKCAFCKQWDFVENLYIPPGAGAIEHRRCGRVYRDQRYRVRMNAAQSATS